MILMKQFKEETKQKLSASLSKQELDLLPSGFQKIGDIIILNLNLKLKNKRAIIGESVLNIFPNIKTVCDKSGGITGDLRVPQVKKIAGNGTETIHVENGCKYNLDVTKVMFAKGNVSERGRLPKIIKPGESIIDMFAGIGYFTIPIARHAKPKQIIAIEKNPMPVKFLKDNIKLNGLKNVKVIEGDNREVEGLDGTADRIIMGYLPGTEQFLPAAFKFLKPAGGIIHFHNTYRKQELWDKPLKEIIVAANFAGYDVKDISNKGIVKHFAPGVEHVVIDAHFRAI
jgi:tRNA wybutosine-synthesizing protein 2